MSQNGQQLPIFFPLVFSLSLHVFPSYCTVYFLTGLHLHMWTAAAAPWTRNQPCLKRINEQEQHISPDPSDLTRFTGQVSMHG